MRPTPTMRLLSLVVVGLLVAVGAAGARVVTGTSGNDRLVGNAARGRHPWARRERSAALGAAVPTSSRAGRVATRTMPARGTISSRRRTTWRATSCAAEPVADVVNADLTDSVAARLRARRPPALARSVHDDDAQHETEVEPDSFTFGRTTVATFQVGRSLQRRCDQRRVRGDHRRRSVVAQWAPPGPHCRERPAGPERARERPGRRLRRRARDVAHLDARSRRHGDAARDQPLARRPQLGKCARTRSRKRVAPRGSPSTRTGSRATTRRRRPSTAAATSSTRTPPTRDMLAVSWSDDGGQTWSLPVDIGARPAVGIFPAIRPTGELVVVYLWEAGQFAIAASRSTDGGATWGAPVRIADVDGGCRISGFRAFPLPSADVGRHRPRLGDLARLRVARSLAERRLRRDVARRRGVERTRHRHPRTRRRAPRDRNRLRRPVGSPSRTCARRRRGSTSSSSSRRDRRTSWAVPRRLSAHSMPLRWMPRTTSGRMLGDYISVHYARGRPLVVWVLASEPVGKEPPAGRLRDSRVIARPASEADRMPDGLELEEGRDLPRALRVPL